MSVLDGLREPFEYMRGLRGKSLRNKLIENFNRWICAPKEFEEIVSNVIETLHNASLMYSFTIYLLSIPPDIYL